MSLLHLLVVLSLSDLVHLLHLPPRQELEPLEPRSLTRDVIHVFPYNGGTWDPVKLFISRALSRAGRQNPVVTLDHRNYAYTLFNLGMPPMAMAGNNHKIGQF